MEPSELAQSQPSAMQMSGRPEKGMPPPVPAFSQTQRRQVIEDWSRMDNEWLLVHAGAVQTFHLRHWLYAGAELKELLLSSGFTTVQLYRNFEGAAYGPEATRLIAVARKSGE